MPEFALAFCDFRGISLCDVRAPFTLKMPRNAGHEATVTLQIEDHAAGLLVNALHDGFPRLKVWMDGTLVFNAPWAPSVEDAQDFDQTEGTLTATFRSTIAIEERYTAATRTFSSVDAGQIAWTLISETNTADGHTGIREGTVGATQDRDRTYEHKQVAEAITQLGEVIGGFDWQITPVDEGSVYGAFDAWLSQGADRSVGESAVIFEYGPGTAGNVRSMTRETRRPVNKARMLGADGLTAEATDAPSIATYGVCMTVDQQVDVSEQSTLTAKAQALLRPEPVRVVAFVPDPAIGPQPWADYWLGDTVRFIARHGSISEDLKVRINQIDISVGEEGVVDSVQLQIDQGIA